MLLLVTLVSTVFLLESELKLVIVGTLDGTVYALDENTGKTVWSLSTGSNLIHSSGYINIVPSLDGKLFHVTNFGILEV